MFLVPQINGWDLNPKGAVDYVPKGGCLKMDAVEINLDRSGMVYLDSDGFSLY